jgi:NAD(P)-dependent dehydrogenase (short-subunit alcohol dehydrogenase family)
MQHKKVALITGAAKGIGKATALKFAANNYNLVLIDKDKEALNDTGNFIKKTYKNSPILRGGDIGNLDFLKKCVEKTIEKWSRIDVVVNNAAWRTIETLRTMDIKTWEQTLKVCLTAPAFLSKWSAEVMEKQQIQGVIINISSMMVMRPAGYSPAYIAAKGALESLTKELAVTYGHSGIRVLSIQPGHIETDLSKDYTDEKGESLSDILIANLVNATPLNKGGTPEDIAEAIFWLSSENAAFITGTSLLIDGGFTHNMNDYGLKKRQFPNEF